MLRGCVTAMTKSARTGRAVVSLIRRGKIKPLIETVKKGCEQRQKLRIEIESNIEL